MNDYQHTKNIALFISVVILGILIACIVVPSIDHILRHYFNIKTIGSF
jgi:hypothetical protein